MNEKKDILAELLSAANAVPGFDPTKYAMYTENGGMYLKVFHRKAWFRLKHPTGKIVTKPVALKDNTCVFKAEVYLDVKDEQPIATAYASRCYIPSNPYSMYYVENAETAAVGRALATAGFNVGFTPGEDDEPEFADAPTGNDEKQQENVKDKPKRGRKKKTDTGSDTNNLSDSPELAETDNEEIPVYSSAIAPEEGKMVELPEAIRSNDGGIESEDECEQNAMTVEDAMTVKVTFGRNAGRTLADIILEGERGAETIRWIAEDYNGNDEKLRNAARILMQAANM